MSTLNPISIATIGYDCNSNLDPISRGLHGYVCTGAVPPEPPVDDGGGGYHGAFILDPTLQPEQPKTEAEKLAILAVLAIDEFYE